MNKEIFIEEVEKLGIKINEEKLIRLEKYYDSLKKYNEKINLTNIIEEKEVYLKHFYDSLTLKKAIDLNRDLTLCDVGTGAGFPGIVLKIFFPNLKVVLIDSLRKRTIFLEEVIKTLKLEGITVLTDRAEDHARKNQEKYDIVTCRALSSLNIISELCIPMLKVNGLFIPMKGKVEEELKDSEFLLKLNSKIENIIIFNLPIEESIRTLVVIRKLESTERKYPRHYSKKINCKTNR